MAKTLKIFTIPTKAHDKLTISTGQKRVFDIVVKKRKTVTRRIGRGEQASKRITYSTLVRAKINEPKTTNSFDLVGKKELHSRRDIQRRINSSTSYAKEMFLFLHEHQLDDEKRYRTSLQKNYVGFNKIDARRADSIIELMHKGRLTPEHDKFIQGMMYKYAGQISDLLNGYRKRPTNMSERWYHKGKTMKSGNHRPNRVGEFQTTVKGKNFNPKDPHNNRVDVVKPSSMKRKMIRQPHFAGEMLMYLYEQTKNQDWNGNINVKFSLSNKDRDLLKQAVSELRNISESVSGSSGQGSDLFKTYSNHITQLTKMVSGYANQVTEMLNAHRAFHPHTSNIVNRVETYGGGTSFRGRSRTIYEPALIKLAQKLSEVTSGAKKK